MYSGVDKPKKHASLKPRVAPHEANYHFTRQGGMHASYMRLEDWNLSSNNYLKRYGEAHTKGRPMFDGMYTPSQQKVPLYYAKYNTDSPFCNNNERDSNSVQQAEQVRLRR
jgi:hypothetical protein